MQCKAKLNWFQMISLAKLTQTHSCAKQRSHQTDRRSRLRNPPIRNQLSGLQLAAAGRVLLQGARVEWGWGLLKMS